MGGLGYVALPGKVAVAIGQGSKIEAKRRGLWLAGGGRFWYHQGTDMAGYLMMNRFRGYGMMALALWAFRVGTSSLLGDVTLVYGASPEGGGDPAPTHQVHVREGKLSIANAMDKRLLIFDASAGEARVVDHATRRVAVLDRLGLEKMAANLVETQRQVLADMENRLLNLPVEEREALRRVMDELHAANEPDAVRAPGPRSFEETGKSGDILGKPARETRIRDGARPVGTGWVLDPGTLGIGEGDEETLRAFGAYFAELVKGLPNALQAQLGQLGMLTTEGMILGRVVAAEDDEKPDDERAEAPRILLELLKVDGGAVESGWFEAPEGFVESALDALSTRVEEEIPAGENVSGK